MTMREKMARAGYEQARKNAEAVYPKGAAEMHAWENQSDALKADWLAVVDAALDALMEPTDGMVEAGQLAFGQTTGDIADKSLAVAALRRLVMRGATVTVRKWAAIYVAMIRAAKDGK